MSEEMTLSIVYNNIPFADNCTCSWGMGCVVRIFDAESISAAGGADGIGKDLGTAGRTTILFDTGGNGKVLLSNMRRMGISPAEVDIVMLSHAHGDHTGGLRKFLEQNADVTVYVFDSFGRSFKKNMEETGARVAEVSCPAEILPGVYTTGKLGGYIKEQALAVETSAGPVLITGCSHPGIDVIAERTAEMFEKNIYLITGGFHLGGNSAGKIRNIISRLKELGVQKIAPSHCTGDEAIRLFREAWGDDFIDAGCGAVIEVP